MKNLLAIVLLILVAHFAVKAQITNERIIEVKAWTQPQTILKISWDWVKHIDSDSKWDLLLDIQIRIPKKISKKERELYEQLANEKKLNVNKWWVFEKIFG